MLRLIKGPRSCEFDLNHMTSHTDGDTYRDVTITFYTSGRNPRCPHERRDRLQGEGRWLEV